MFRLGAYDRCNAQLEFLNGFDSGLFRRFVHCRDFRNSDIGPASNISLPPLVLVKINTVPSIQQPTEGPTTALPIKYHLHDEWAVKHVASRPGNCFVDSEIDHVYNGIHE